MRFSFNDFLFGVVSFEFGNRIEPVTNTSPKSIFMMNLLLYQLCDVDLTNAMGLNHISFT